MEARGLSPRLSAFSPLTDGLGSAALLRGVHTWMSPEHSGISFPLVARPARTVPAVNIPDFVPAVLHRDRSIYPPRVTEAAFVTREPPPSASCSS